MIDSIFRTGKNYYSQVFLGESKNVVKENKLSKYTTDDVEKFRKIRKILMIKSFDKEDQIEPK